MQKSIDTVLIEGELLISQQPMAKDQAITITMSEPTMPLTRWLEAISRSI